MATTQTLTAIGPSEPVVLRPQTVAGFSLLATVYCIVAAGAALTYSVEVSPDANEPRQWVAMDDGSTGMTASKVQPLAFKARAVRANVTSLTSGSLAFTALQ